MTNISLRTTVRGSGPGLLLAHGAGGGIEANFGTVIPRLAQDHTVVGPDYPDDNEALDLDELADALVAAAVNSGVAQFTIVGFSLGAAVAVRAATRHPERARGLILTAGFAAPDNRLRLAMDIWRALLRAGDYETFARFGLSSALSAAFVNEAIPGDQLPVLVEQAAKSIPAGTAAQAALVLETDVRGDLAAISVPALVIATTRDLLADPSNSVYLTDSIPGAEVLEIATGHMAMAEAPDQWYQAVDEFLRRHRL
jgi:pimeloyl-ACP methyl ester carboxylesterase